MLVLRLRVQIVTRRVLWPLHCMFKCVTSAVDYFLQNVLALLQGMLELEYSPLELAACFHIINASERAICFFMVGGATSELATLLLSILCLMLPMMDWHVPESVKCHMLLPHIASP